MTARKAAACGDRGNASLVLVAGAVLVMIMLLALADLGIFLIARAKAQTAADAAALAAAAESIPGGRGDGSALAARYAQANGAELVECECPNRGRFARVSVELPVRFLVAGLLGVDAVEASAQAEASIPGWDTRPG